MSSSDLGLLTVDLESLWYIKCHVIKVCMKFERNGAIPSWIIDNFANFRTHCHLWPLDLELLQHFGCHAFKLHTKFERSWIIHSWVIVGLARFRDGHKSFLSNGWIQLHQTWPGHGAIIAALHFCFRIRISCCIFKCGQLKVDWCFKDAKFCTFWPLVKIRGGWARSLYQVLKLYLQPNLRNTFNGHPLHCCWALWIDKKERKKKESSWVKLKAFPTTIGQPNNRPAFTHSLCACI